MAAWDPFWIYGVLIFPLQREVQDADDKNHHVSGPGGVLVCHHRPEGCVFHIQVIQRHRRFLRFAFGGKAYQYKVLPFGLALAPRTFTKCMDAALTPLRLQGIRVLNYLDDWLILAHSRELVSRHRDIVLGHIHSLGLSMNAKKSVLLPSQRTVFLGVRLESVQMQARLAPARIPVLTACLVRFKLGHHVSVGTCRRLLGLMAAASPVLPLGLLHMRPFLWWMKELRLHPTVPATRLIPHSKCIKCLGFCTRSSLWRVRRSHPSFPVAPQRPPRPLVTTRTGVQMLSSRRWRVSRQASPFLSLPHPSVCVIIFFLARGHVTPFPSD